MEIAELFRGFEGAYGVYRVDESTRSGATGKVKGQARTVREPVTPGLWLDHLEGTMPIGIITITERDTCWWGCIDVDDYTVDGPKLAKRIKKLGLPLVPCRTKSGGVHCYVFFAEEVPAWLVRQKLNGWAAAIGHGGSEIFPKQDSVNLEDSDLASWVNMPYYDAETTTRYAWNTKGEALDLPLFLEYAAKQRLTKEKFEATEPKKLKRESDDFTDGPVCFELLTSQGKIGSGVRNRSLLGMGVYAKKRWPEDWATHVHRMNSSYIGPPLPPGEVGDIIKHLQKKDYFYPCKESPLADHCNGSLCRTRPHGVGNGEGGSNVVITDLRKLDTEPPIWYIDIEDIGTVSLNTDQLASHTQFRKCCMEQLTIYPVVNAKAWAQLLVEAMDRVVIVDMTQEEKDQSGTTGEFQQLAQEFFGRSHGEDEEELLLRKVWYDEVNGRLVFRLQDFIAFLDQRRFTKYTRPRICSVLKQWGAQIEPVKRVKGVAVRSWSMPEDWG